MDTNPPARRLVAVLLALLVALASVTGAACAPARAEEAADAAAPAADAPSADAPPAISSAGALVLDRTTGTTLFEQNADTQMCLASITKVMTALLVLENVDDLDAQVTVEESDLERITWMDSVAGLRAGETYTVRDLLACMLLPSGNDASYVLARYVGGGDWHAFVDLMNQRATELGCTGTHFVNPCGMDEDGHHSTPRDVATFFQEALNHPEFVQIAGSATWDLPETSEQAARTLKNTDLLIQPKSPLYLPDTVGASKTGTTVDAGRCLVAEGTRDGMDLIVVTLGAPMDNDDSNFVDVRALLEWGFGAWRTGEVVSEGEVLAEVPVTLSDSGETVGVQAQSPISGTVPRDTTLDDLTVELSWSDPLTAPLGRGQGLGRATVSIDGRELGTVEVAAASAMGLSLPKLVQTWLDGPAPLVVATVVAAVIALAALVAIASACVRAARRRSARSSHAAHSAHAAPTTGRGASRRQGSVGHVPAAGPRHQRRR